MKAWLAQHGLGDATRLDDRITVALQAIAHTPMTFLDSPEGRYSITERANWLTFAPLDQRLMTTRLTELLTGQFS